MAPADATGHSWFTGVILPLVIFPAITAFGIQCYWEPFLAAGGLALSAKDNRACYPYTSYADLDVVVCRLVDFFEPVLKPATLPFTAHFLANATPIFAFVFLESARARRSLLLTTPVQLLITAGCQLFTAGLTMPVFWLLFLLGGHAALHAPSSPGRIAEPQALAGLFALVLGYVLPTLLMLTLGLTDARLVGYWQLFPLWVFAAQRLYLLVGARRGAAEHGGYAIVQLTYALAFVLAAVPHVLVVFSRLDLSDVAGGSVLDGSDWSALKALFVPSLQVPKRTAQLNLLQWDYVFTLGSSYLAALWFSRSADQFIMLALWLAIGGAVLGPGAALTAIYMWREAKLVV